MGFSSMRCTQKGPRMAAMLAHWLQVQSMLTALIQTRPQDVGLARAIKPILQSLCPCCVGPLPLHASPANVSEGLHQASPDSHGSTSCDMLLFLP